MRDCTSKCYGYDKYYIPSSKLCIDDCKSNNMLVYNYTCYDICPSRKKFFLIIVATISLAKIFITMNKQIA